MAINISVARGRILLEMMPTIDDPSLLRRRCNIITLWQYKLTTNFVDAGTKHAAFIYYVCIYVFDCQDRAAVAPS